MTGQDIDFTKSGVSRFPNRDLGVPRFKCEVGVPLAQQKEFGHNRFHPDIPPLFECDPGDEVILETPGYDDYQLRIRTTTVNPISISPAPTRSPVRSEYAARNPATCSSSSCWTSSR